MLCSPGAGHLGLLVEAARQQPSKKMNSPGSTHAAWECGSSSFGGFELCGLADREEPPPLHSPAVVSDGAPSASLHSAHCCSAHSSSEPSTLLSSSDPDSSKNHIRSVILALHPWPPPSREQPPSSSVMASATPPPAGPSSPTSSAPACPGFSGCKLHRFIHGIGSIVTFHLLVTIMSLYRFPDAPIQPVTLNMGTPMRSWSASMPNQTRPKCPELMSIDLEYTQDFLKVSKLFKPWSTSRSKLASPPIGSSLVDSLKVNCHNHPLFPLLSQLALVTHHTAEPSLSYPPCFSLTFLTGGAISILTGLMCPSPLAGVVSLSGFLPLKDKIKQVCFFILTFFLCQHEGNKNCILCPAHFYLAFVSVECPGSPKENKLDGDARPDMIAIFISTVSNQLGLKNVVFKSYPGEIASREFSSETIIDLVHSASPLELRDLAEWLMTRIPSQ
ncbi:hypothetical protein VP01_1831g3 [Puccinia sorghi]|uniref:Uncharacterized protein n=1 Tax=Puccinia sorghi TaxID=27349 RepID=A0A0L6VDV7_9BASI|nr:hypothetical protein VP01_1831g3 [Puccinia sorghi]